LIHLHLCCSPLGPFIPAPPDVAMRMMRDQGGPPPFEPTVAPHPRKAGRGGIPPMGGPSPIFNAPPPLPHDPRRIRRSVLMSRSQQFATF
jgi:hypothetical protein